jgi:aspartate dehydrogenase
VSVRFAIIGFGAIADEVVRAREERDELERLVGVLVRPQRRTEAAQKAAGRFAVVDSIDALCGLEPDIVAECAGHGAMRDYAAALLQRGIDVLCSSVGVLADRKFADELVRAARGAELFIPSGAIAGIDGLLAARTAGLERVAYTSVKPPVAWIGTAAEPMLAGAARDKRTTLFEGSAREAALAYPKNVNVGATVALAGLGLDRTKVSLVSDPGAAGPLGIIDASGAFGTLRFEILAYASPSNPKTSLLTAHSIIAAVQAGVRFSALPMLTGSD